MSFSRFTAYPDNRVIPFEGVHNFRDMGGYRTSDGRKIKYGLFFRSGELAGMTEQDKALFQTLNIRTIFDYRDDFEAEHRPTPLWPNIEYLRVPAMTLASYSHVTSMKEWVKLSKDFSVEKIIHMYATLPFQNASYQQLMKLVQDPNRLGLVHHCHAGKDRTGVGTALILLALGVPKEFVIEDYLITNQTFKEAGESMLKQIADQMNEEEIHIFRQIMGANKEFIEAVFNAIEEKYDDFDTYFAEEFGLTAEKREALQSYCLE